MAEYAISPKGAVSVILESACKTYMVQPPSRGGRGRTGAVVPGTVIQNLYCCYREFSSARTTLCLSWWCEVSFYKEHIRIIGGPERGTPRDHLNHCFMVITKHILQVLQGECGRSSSIGSGSPARILCREVFFSIMVPVFDLVFAANRTHRVMWLLPHPLGVALLLQSLILLNEFCSQNSS